MRILFIGDIVGRPGRRTVKNILKKIIEEEDLDLVIGNGENAAGGFGLSYETCQELLYAGIDVITLGNHTWDNKDIFNTLERETRVVRPANYPADTPGQGYYLAETTKGDLVGVINLLGQVFLEALASPFEVATELIDLIKPQTNIILVDFHGEATSEKMALGYYLDGQVTAVVGTHTHVQTADEQLLPKGTAYITDVGMTGPSNSILGIDPKIVVKKFITKLPVRFEVAKGATQFNGVIIEVDLTGRATSIKRIQRNMTN